MKVTRQHKLTDVDKIQFQIILGCFTYNPASLPHLYIHKTDTISEVLG